MNQTSGRHKQLVLEAFIVGFVLAIVTHALPALQEQALLGPGRTDVSSNRTAICPKGWVIAVAEGHGTLGHAPEQLCVRLNTREQTWRSARRVCRESKGFLIKLDSILKIDNFLLADYLQQQGVDRVWTGMHHDYDRLLWDDLRPQMVKYYYGHLESTGWRKRGWRLDPSTFQNGNNTCGVLQVAGADSGEVSEETTGIRDKRSPLQPPGDGRPMPRPMFPRMGKDVPRRVDNEDLPQAKSPTQETKLENLQQFLSNQGFQEKYVESIGDSPNTGKSDKTNKPHTLDGTTTSTTTTDQSNLEDDDYHVVTKRSLSKTTTTVPPHNNTKAASGQTAAPKFAPQKSVKGTSLPTYTAPQTTAPPETTTTVDQLLQKLLQASIDKASSSKLSGAGGPEKPIGAPDVAFDSDFQTFIQSQNPSRPLNIQQSEESTSHPLNIQKSAESNSMDSNEYLKTLLRQATATVLPSNTTVSANKSSSSDVLSSLLEAATGGVASGKTSTTVPKTQLDINGIQSLNFDPNNVVTGLFNPSTSTSRGYTKESTVPAKATTSYATESSRTDTSNSVLSVEDSQYKDAKKSNELLQDVVTPKSVTDILKSVIDSIFTSKSTPAANVVSTSTASTTTTDAEDSGEVFDSTGSVEFTTVTSPTTDNIISTPTADSDQNSAEVDSGTSSSSNSTENLFPSLEDLDSASAANDSAEVVDVKAVNTTGTPVDSPEIFDVKGLLDSQENQGNVGTAQPTSGDSAIEDSSNAAKEVVSAGVDSAGTSVEGNQDSLLQDSQELLHDTSTENTGPPSSMEVSGATMDTGSLPPDTMELEACDEAEASVCATEAIEELSLVGHCERNWYGHRLLDRCYKPLGFTLTEIEARQRCLHYSASLATADTEFYVNILAMLLDDLVQQKTFGRRVWVDTTLNLDIPVDGQCTALEDGQLHRVSCGLRLPFFCQKDDLTFAPNFDDIHHRDNSVTFVRNMTSFQPQTLWCPLRMAAADDVIIWFKDGRPITNQEDDDTTSFGFRNGQMPIRLDVELSILERVGEGGARIPKPAMLQGEYWCEIWRREPFERVVSHKIYLKFTDVITLHGEITTRPTDHVTAAIFNSMGHVTGLPAIMERDLATMNKNITHFLRSVLPIVRDVITYIKSTSPLTGKSEFITYICIATGHLSPHMRGNLADLYLSTFSEALVINEDQIRQAWNLTLPLHQAVTITMPDMCPEANLVDKVTGLSATFPSTPVNQRALSRDYCNGLYSGNAWCRGDLQTGAYWDSWSVTGTCYHKDQELTSSSEDEDDTSSQTHNEYEDSKVDDIIDVGDGFIPGKPPKPALLELDEIEIESANVADVTERLANILEEEEDLTETDIETIAQVVDRIVSVKKPPSEVSNKLIKTVNKVLDAPEKELRNAEMKSRAPSRLIRDLEIFGEKVDMGVDPRIRQVTPNVAMEIWNLEDSSDVVIGFGAAQMSSWAAPLSDPRIVTIKDRAWAAQNLQSFDVAIELPESLVKNTVRYSDSSLRLTMFIYRKPGLFLPMDDDHTDLRHGSVNSAIISASLGGRKIRGLEDKVKLVFKPFTDLERDEDDTPRCVFWDTESSGTHPRWSSEGCVYNGTMNGRDVCLCDHLTNFAILMDYYGDNRPISSDHETSLSILTLIGISLSIIGLSITIITFLAFKKLRQGRAQQTLFNMAIALLCFQTTFLVGVKQTSITSVCLAVAVLLHYFILVSFAWMLIEAVLQYLTFVKVLGTYISRYTLKTVLPAWGIPLLPVIAVLATDYNLYLGRTNYCWMDLKAFYYAFALPVGIIIVFNIVMFFVIIISLVTRPKGLRSNQASNKTRETNLKAAFTIFILLGLTWLFGYLAIEDARLPFQYAFTIFSSLQGFLIFVLMVARRRQVRDHWEMMCCCRRKGKQHKQKKLSPTLSGSTTSNNSISNSRTLPSFINHAYNGDSMVLSSSALQRQTSISV